MTNIILCRGHRTKRWSISRTLIPKQFVKLFSNKSLFQLTVKRNFKLCKSQFIVSNSEQYFLVLDQLEKLRKINNNYLLESIGINTVPAIALEYDEIVLSVAHNEFKHLKFKTDSNVVFDIKSILDYSDERL